MTVVGVYYQSVFSRFVKSSIQALFRSELLSFVIKSIYFVNICLQFVINMAIFQHKKTLYKSKEKRYPMKEQELNAAMSVITDPVKNVYKLETRQDIEEIQRIIRIFNISREQQNKHRMLSIKNLATLRLVLSNN